MADTDEHSLMDAMARAREGDAGAFETVIRETISALRAWALWRLGDATTAEDLIQECYVTVWSKRMTYEPGREVLPWLRGFLRIAALRHLRDRTRKREEFIGSFEQKLLDYQIGLSEDEEEGSDHRQQIANLRTCLKRLGPKARQAIEDHYLKAESAESIASSMGKTLGALRTLMYRARRQLLACMQMGSRHE